MAIATSQKEKPHIKVGENVFEILDEKPQYDVAINDCLVVFSKHYAERENFCHVATMLKFGAISARNKLKVEFGFAVCTTRRHHEVMHKREKKKLMGL